MSTEKEKPKEGADPPKATVAPSEADKKGARFAKFFFIAIFGAAALSLIILTQVRL